MSIIFNIIIREFIGLWDIEWKHLKLQNVGGFFLNHPFFFCLKKFINFKDTNFITEMIQPNMF